MNKNEYIDTGSQSQILGIVSGSFQVLVIKTCTFSYSVEVKDCWLFKLLLFYEKLLAEETCIVTCAIFVL